jgi:hypothetical protein
MEHTIPAKIRSLIFSVKRRNPRKIIIKQPARTHLHKINHRFRRRLGHRHCRCGDLWRILLALDANHQMRRFVPRRIVCLSKIGGFNPRVFRKKFPQRRRQTFRIIRRLA